MTSNKIIIGEWTRFSLRQCWIWPARHQEMNPSKWLYLKLAFLLVLSVFVLLVPTVINTQYRIKCTGQYVLTQELFVGVLDSQNPSEDFALIVSYCGFVLMMTLYVVNHKRVAELMRRLSDFEDFGKPPGFDRFNTKMEFFSKLFIWYSILSILFYKCFKLYQIPDCKRERGSFEVCGLITPIWKPWSGDPVPILILTLDYTLFYGAIMTSSVLLIGVQVLEISLYIKLRLDHLKLMLLTCFDQDTRTNRKLLNNCINYHQNIIRSKILSVITLQVFTTNVNFSLTELMNDGFSSITFAHIVTATLACGSLESDFVNVRKHNFL
jgi:hypothetical protein